MKRRIYRMTLILPLLAWAGVAAASDFGITAFGVAGGGGTSSGGAFVLNGTAGQPAAAALGGGAYGLLGGFWPAAGSEEGAPPIEPIDDTGDTIFPLSYPGRYVTVFAYDETEDEWYRLMDVTLSPSSVTFPMVQTGRWYWLAVLVYNPNADRWELDHGSWFGRH